MRLRDTAVRLRAGLEEGYGGVQVRDWDNATPTPLAVNVQPEPSTEINGQRMTTVTRWRLFAGPGDDILATDRIAWAGRTLEVDGDVEEWRRHGVLHHLEVRLKLITDSDG